MNGGFYHKMLGQFTPPMKKPYKTACFPRCPLVIEHSCGKSPLFTAKSSNQPTGRIFHSCPLAIKRGLPEKFFFPLKPLFIDYFPLPPLIT